MLTGRIFLGYAMPRFHKLIAIFISVCIEIDIMVIYNKYYNTNYNTQIRMTIYFNFIFLFITYNYYEFTCLYFLCLVNSILQF